MIDEKEDMLKVFRHEKPEGLPHLLSEGVHFLAPQNGFCERPAGGKGGYDWFGVKWNYIEGDLAPVPDTTAPLICENICDWEKAIKFPNLEKWDWDRAAEIDHVAEIDRDHKMLYTSSLNGFFERMHTLLGFENALCSLLTDPEETEAFLDAMVVFKCTELTKIKEYYNPDILNFHDDYGTQKGLFFSPELWRSMFKPRLKKVVDHCHSLGMIFELHSCGLIEEIIEDICETGVDCLQCMDINDIQEAKSKTKNRMAYGVSPNFQKYAAGLETGKMRESDIRREVHQEIMTLSENGNYYPFINPPLTEMDRYIWEEAEICRQEIIEKSKTNEGEE